MFSAAMPWKGGGLSRITGAIDYNRFAPSGQSGQRGFIKDSQILETAAARGEIPESNEWGGDRFTGCNTPDAGWPHQCRRFEVPTAVAAGSFRNFKSKSGTRIINLLVPLCFRSSCH